MAFHNVEEFVVLVVLVPMIFSLDNAQADHRDVYKRQPPVSPGFDRRLYRRIDEVARFSWWERLTRAFRRMPLSQAVPLTASAGLLLMACLLYTSRCV